MVSVTRVTAVTLPVNWLRQLHRRGLGRSLSQVNAWYIDGCNGATYDGRLFRGAGDGLIAASVYTGINR